jgi:glycine oxidase
MEAGAHGVAVLSGICHAGDPVRATEAYVDALRRVLQGQRGPRPAGAAAAVPERADVVVVGGGIIGMAVGHELAVRGRSVLVLDRQTDDGAAWRAAAGMLAPTLEADTFDPRLIELCLHSVRLYPDWVAGVERESGLRVGYRTEGSLQVALNADHRAELVRLKGFADRLGVECQWLSAAETLEREPHLHPRVVGALAATGDRQVDPRALVVALRVALQRRGGQVLGGASVLAVEAADGGPRLRVRLADGLSGDEVELRAATVVLANGAFPVAGPGSPKSDPATALPLRPVKGQVLRLHGPPLIRHVVRTPDVYLVPRQGGELVVGATSEEQGLCRRATAGGAHDLLREAFRVLPGIYELELCEVGVGFRPALRDHLPALGSLPGHRDIFVASGHYRNGILLAAATATFMAELVQGAPVPGWLDAFAPHRFIPVTSA